MSGPSPRPRILLVEDEPDMAETLAAALHDCEVVLAADGRSAFERCREQRFDLILCDLMLPGMTGMDLHEALERTAPDLARRMLFLTGGAFSPRARLFLEDRGRLYLEKPFRLTRLREAVRSLLTAFGPAGFSRG